MKAWRFYAFSDMRLDDLPPPALRPRHVLAEILCVQPSVTEAQLVFGIPTLAFERIKRRLETEAPIQLFGHEYCARVMEVGKGVTRFRPGDRVWPGNPIWLKIRDSTHSEASGSSPEN